MRSILTWKCKNCEQLFQRVNTGHAYRFCCRACVIAVTKPSSYLRIPDEKPMSIRTLARRKKEAGLVTFRTYPFNEDFFQTWGDAQAWIMGLIWSDGCLFRNSIEICSKDRDLLEIVAELIGQEEGVRSKNNGTAWRIVFTSKQTTNFLRSLGLSERKSHTANWPEIPSPYQASFVRGILDGDGSVLTRNSRPGQQVADIEVQFVGAAPQVRDGLFAWLTHHDIHASRGISHHTVWRINISAHKSLRILYSLLYPDAAVPCLRRKRAPFDLWLSTPRPRLGRPKKSP